MGFCTNVINLTFSSQINKNGGQRRYKKISGNQFGRDLTKKHVFKGLNDIFDRDIHSIYRKNETITKNLK